MKKYLLAYQINNQIVGVDITSWDVQQLNGNKPFIIVYDNNLIPNNYVDISSIITWDMFGRDVSNDYLVYRDSIKEIVFEKTWENLTDIEKDIAIKYNAIIDSSDAITFLMNSKQLTIDQAQLFLIQSWHKHHGFVVESCVKRWYYVKLIVPMFLSFEDAEDLLNTIEPLVFSLVYMGRQGINYGDKKEGIMDFIESTNLFMGRGLRESGYTLLQGTWNDFIIELKKVLVDGIY